MRRNQEEYALEPRLMQVLVHLAERPGAVVSRNELLQTVWGETVVQEEALTQAISQLRRVLGDSSRTPTIIETVPKKGYRLIARVSSAVSGESEPLASGPSSNKRTRIVALSGLVVAFLLFFLIREFKPVPAPVLLEIHPLTTLPGDEVYPAISPNGELVVFSWRPADETSLKLYLKRVGSEDLIALTEGPGRDSLPCWSPAGDRIAFVRNRDGERRICVVAAIGGPVQELSGPHWAMGGLDWSPDGATIVYSCKDEREAPMRLMLLGVADDPADGHAEVLTTPENLSRGDTYPRYSPDGSLLAFIHSDRGITRDIYLMPAGGGEARKLTQGFFACGGLDWAPDSESLILSATYRGPYELWRVDADNGDLTRMPARTPRSFSPACAQDSGALVFTDATLDIGLMIGSLDSEFEPRITAPSTRLDMTGRLSPDGSRILFVSDRSGPSELWIWDRESQRARALTDFGGATLRRPRWSPDGRRVAVNVGRDGLLQIVVIDVASGLQIQATPNNGHHRLGHWSADGQTLFYSRENGPDWQIASVGFDGTGAADIPAPGCLSLHEQESGELFYFKETEDGLFVRPAAGGEQKVVEPDQLFDTIHMQMTDSGYWFIRFEEETACLAFYDLATGQVEDRVELAGDPLGEFHVSADGKHFVYSTIVQSGNDLMIVPELHGSAQASR